MAIPRRVGPRQPRSTPPGLGASWPDRPLPTDLLRQASARLGIVSILGAALWTVATLLGHLADGVPFPHPLDAVAATSVAASLALFAYARTSRRSPEFILDLGLGYVVLTGIAIGLTAHLTPFGTAESLAAWRLQSDISWIGVLVVMFAAIVPTSPKKMFATALVAVSMNPIAMLIALARGTWQFGPPINALVMHYPDYLLVGIATVISHVVTQLGRQVAVEREMGSYELGDLLGRGGMGEVYRATHRMLARPAAIKLMRPEMLGARDADAAQLAVKRFRREAAAAASLRSPHTVAVYDFGVTEEQTLYFVMELLEGMDLETFVQRHGPMPAARVVHVLRQVCDSLAEAHAQGLVHRDIKPANIHIGCVGLQGDFVKVLDFGIVKTPAGADAHDTLATAAGTTVGTPAYMAPELALGEGVDGRADLYALGCVAYYLLTGELVFEADGALQMLAKHMRAEPIPPSRRTDRAIPPALDRLVMACLEKDPARRPQSAEELTHALSAIAEAAWNGEQAMRWWSTTRGTAAAGLVRA